VKITWGKQFGQRGFPGKDLSLQGGAGRFTPTPGDAHDGGEWDNHAIECAICAYPIADYRAVTVCPLCEQTNFLPKTPWSDL
jgi:rubrerythrin